MLVSRITEFFSSAATFHHYQVTDLADDIPQIRLDPFADAIQAAIDDGIDIVNLSVGIHRAKCPGVCPFCEAAKRAVDAGITVVAGSGNRYTYAGPTRVFCPARREGVIAVGGMEVHCPKSIDIPGVGCHSGTDDSPGPYWMNKRADAEYGADLAEGVYCGQQGCLDDDDCLVENTERSWSGNVRPYRDKPDVLAPVHYPVARGDGKLELKAGTSFSTPIVTGIVGMVIDEFRQETGKPPDPAAARRAVRESAEPIGESELRKLNTTRMMNTLFPI